MPACLSRAPAHSPAKPPPMSATVDLVEQRLALDPLDVGIVDEVREPARGLEVLVVAVGPQPLVALGAVPGAQRVVVVDGGAARAMPTNVPPTAGKSMFAAGDMRDASATWVAELESEVYGVVR